VCETVGDGICSDSGDTDSSWVLDSESMFHVYPRRDWFDSLDEMSSGIVTLANGSTLSVVGVGMVRF
jgi:hypothetical protein